MYLGGLQGRIAEKNSKENVHTKIENKQQNHWVGSIGFSFLILQSLFCFWSHTNFFHGKQGFSIKNQKNA